MDLAKKQIYRFADVEVNVKRLARGCSLKNKCCKKEFPISYRLAAA